MNSRIVPEQIHSLIPAKSEKVFMFLDAWKFARSGSLVPLRKNIDPLRFARILSAVWIYQYDKDGGDFICQLAGEEINHAWGRNIKGTGLKDMVSAENYDSVLARWFTILNSPNLEYSMITEYHETRTPYQVERLLLPLATKPGQTDCVMGLSLFDSSPWEQGLTATTGDFNIQVPIAEI